MWAGPNAADHSEFAASGTKVSQPFRTEGFAFQLWRSMGLKKILHKFGFTMGRVVHPVIGWLVEPNFVAKCVTWDFQSFD